MREFECKQTNTPENLIGECFFFVLFLPISNQLSVGMRSFSRHRHSVSLRLISRFMIMFVEHYLIKRIARGYVEQADRQQHQH